jgi:hypothetical protein
VWRLTDVCTRVSRFQMLDTSVIRGEYRFVCTYMSTCVKFFHIAFEIVFATEWGVLCHDREIDDGPSDFHVGRSVVAPTNESTLFELSKAFESIGWIFVSCHKKRFNTRGQTTMTTERWECVCRGRKTPSNQSDVNSRSGCGLPRDNGGNCSWIFTYPVGQIAMQSHGGDPTRG